MNSTQSSPKPKPSHAGTKPRTNVGQFARWLKIARLRSTYHGKPLTQAQLAKLMGVPLRRIQKMEQGEQVLRMEWVEQFAEFFKYDRDKLYAMAFELAPDMQLFLTTTLEGEKVLENIRTKIMPKVPNPTYKRNVPKRVQDQEWRTQYHGIGTRTRLFSSLDDRILEEEIFGKDE